jgi:hypothetical protein
VEAIMPLITPSLAQHFQQAGQAMQRRAAVNAPIPPGTVAPFPDLTASNLHGQLLLSGQPLMEPGAYRQSQADLMRYLDKEHARLNSGAAQPAQPSYDPSLAKARQAANEAAMKAEVASGKSHPTLSPSQNFVESSGIGQAGDAVAKGLAGAGKVMASPSNSRNVVARKIMQP